LIKGGAAKALRGTNVAKAELGTKRLCPNCGAKYYDLNHDPIICPRCGTQFEVTSARARAVAKAAVVAEEEDEVEEAAPAEFVSLEEADEETADSGKVDADVGDDEVEVADEADDTFLEEEEEEGDDVADIIGDVDEEER
jgi:uncharacterized protein (TIGR02300 family)